MDRTMDLVLKLIPHQPLLLMLDFDGTLVPIARTPDAIQLPPQTSRLLSAVQASGHRVVIITGRTREDVLSRLTGNPEVIGLHGLSWPGAALPATNSHTAQAAERLEVCRALFPGVLIERKGPCLAVHTRQVDARLQALARARIDRILRRAMMDAKGRLSILRGKAVQELRPVEASKAYAVKRLCTENQLYWPLYIGDDVTDEEAIAAIPAARGMGLRVAAIPCRTAAGARLHSPAAVHELLRRLVERGTPALTDDACAEPGTPSPFAITGRNAIVADDA